ncbi:hypothetical protein E5288_WYG011135 [Bos mutus]|uniref:Uncharacterized protein n=1 Tax=Bos mutus TaxID=72004 RepID=A0A6B0RP33_9CETA|nr:hypothetical protein [Bos mutus]
MQICCTSREQSGMICHYTCSTTFRGQLLLAASRPSTHSSGGREDERENFIFSSSGRITLSCTAARNNLSGSKLKPHCLFSWIPDIEQVKINLMELNFQSFLNIDITYSTTAHQRHLCQNWKRCCRLIPKSKGPSGGLPKKVNFSLKNLNTYSNKWKPYLALSVYLRNEKIVNQMVPNRGRELDLTIHLKRTTPTPTPS